MDRARAGDGRGNAAEIGRAVARGDPPAAGEPARVAALRAGFSRGRLVVRLTLSANARVSIQLLRRTVVSTPRRRVVLSGANTPVIRSLAAGRRLVRLARPKRLRPGFYVVRVRVLSPRQTGAVRTSRVLTVKAPVRRG